MNAFLFLKKKKTKEREGYEHMPIFDFIDFGQVHCDSLHENMNNVNHLLELLFQILVKHDNKRTLDLQKLPLQRALSEFLNSIKIKSPFTLMSLSDSSTSQLSLRKFTGAQCRRIAQHIQVDKLFPTIEKSAKIGQLFNNWWRIHMGYTHNFYIDKTELLHERVEDWLSTFKECFHD